MKNGNGKTENERYITLSEAAKIYGDDAGRFVYCQNLRQFLDVLLKAENLIE